MPFWWRHGVDADQGGVSSCMTEDGRRLSRDRYTWSQARWLWVTAALYNRIERRPEFLDAARRTAGFLLRHGRDAEGRWVYAMSGDGATLEGPISIYADCFAVYGLNEYHRATGDAEALRVARETYHRVVRRVEEPDFGETAPYAIPPGRRLHAIPMILCEVAQELGEAEQAGEYARRILEHFVRPDWQVLVEYLDRDYRLLPAPEGTAVVPGHAIESMWFVLHWARRVGRADAIVRAVEVIRWHLEKGWDPEFGGIFLGIDALGAHPPAVANAEKKVWWPHTEALYALLLAHHLTAEPWCLEWYRRVLDWSEAHFAMPETGEWRQRLDRQGRPITELIALPVKDPFHLPRAAILAIELLENEPPQK